MTAKTHSIITTRSVTRLRILRYSYSVAIQISSTPRATSTPSEVRHHTTPREAKVIHVVMATGALDEKFWQEEEVILLILMLL